MHLNLFELISVSVPTFAVVIIFISTGLCSSNERYLGCSASFQCANIQDISYPFWGPNRPDYCGYPGFQLDCNGQAPMITIMQLTYQVLDINNMTQTVKLARTDYMKNLCPTFLVNSTLNLNLFNYTSDTQNVTLHYGCPTNLSQYSNTFGLSRQYACTINGTGISCYYLTKNLTGSSLGSSADAISSYLKLCNNSVVIAANQSDIQSMTILNTANLTAVLNHGFGLQWTANDRLCSECKVSGGQCGYNYTTDEFTCYCPDQAHAFVCGQSTAKQHGTGGGSQLPLTIGLAIAAAAIFVICLGFCLCFPRTARSACGKATKLCCGRRKGNGKIEAFILNYQFQIPKRFSHSDIKRMTNSFAEKLGHGGFGSVYKGKLPDGRLVAVKVLKKSKGDGEEFINEVASIGRTSHVNVVTLLGFCYEGTKRALIYDYMPNGSLDKFIYNRQSPSTGPCLEWKTLYEIAMGIARGLEYLHRGCNTRIVHFDIKPHNILLDQDFCPKISDFGLAKLCKGKESKVSMLGARGTVGYIAPEVFCRNFGGVSYKSDVYSYGMMVLEMVGGKQNVDIEVSNSSEVYFPDCIYRQLEPGEISRLHEGITEEEEETMKKMILVGLWCIQTNPSDRPSMTKVVEMLEGSLESLQVPPKPFLSSPARPPVEFSSMSSLQMYSFSRKDEEMALS